MEIQIEVQLFVNGAKFLQSGSCTVITTDFRKEPDWTTALSAYEWIQKWGFL
ncbi:hypothetical protein ABEY41_16890 [Peribacillus butanolivorans]|uniref:hypothetical protein n=1 Tax=Peribacillus butanolivorans TaxID=421767 RepID=UPI003D2A068A